MGESYTNAQGTDPEEPKQASPSGKSPPNEWHLLFVSAIASLVISVLVTVAENELYTKNELNSIQSDVNKLGTQLGQLQLDLLEAQFQLDQLEEDIQNIEDDVDPLEARLDGLTLKVDETLANATLLAAEIEDIRDQTAADSADVQAQLDSLNITEIDLQVQDVNAIAQSLGRIATELTASFVDLEAQFNESDIGTITNRLTHVEQRRILYESFSATNLTGGWRLDGEWYRELYDAPFCATPPIQGDVDMSVDMSSYLDRLPGDAFQLVVGITDSNANNDANDFGNFNVGLICVVQEGKPSSWRSCRRYLGREYLSKRTHALSIKWDSEGPASLRIQALGVGSEGFNRDPNCGSANLNGFSLQLEGALYIVS